MTAYRDAPRSGDAGLDRIRDELLDAAREAS